MTKFTNSLINESSPYLLQHAHNPVNWYPWGPQALEKAQKEDKLLLISIGYSSCHWCHVMEHESFENEEIARIMNDKYICIKVDREERPDIDQVYMNAVQLMTGQGGWPLNCFALPDQRPVYGGTYFRPEDWKSLLLNLDEFFRKKRPEAEAYAAKLTAGIRQSEQVLPAAAHESFAQQDLREVLEPWQQYFDFKEGGHARAPKFPMPNNFLFLLRYAHHWGEEPVAAIVRLTLDKMCRGGIYDQLGGGFSRYSVDAAWHVPHFEKMLYDNGQLVSLYSEAFTYCKSNEYKEVVYQTLDFIEREMTAPGGGFYSALDADSEGVEGKFYCWTMSQVEAAGIARRDVFCTYFDITEDGNWEGTNVLRRLHTDEEVANRFSISPAQLRQIISAGKKKLMALRDERIRPGLDDKILASWNGIMLRGLLDAYRAFGEQRFLACALKNAGFIKEQLLIANDELLRSCKAGKIGAAGESPAAGKHAAGNSAGPADVDGGHSGKAGIKGFLDDYAFVADGFIALYEATFDEQWLVSARALAERALGDFYNPESGMFFYTGDGSEALIDRKYETADNVMPASNSMMARVLYRLGLFFDEPRYLEISRGMLRKIIKPMKGYGSAYSNWAILLQNQVAGMYQVAITGKDAPEKRAAIDKAYIPNKVLLGGEAGTLPLLEGKLSGEQLIYVCRDNTCKLPVSEVAEAIAQMRDSE